MTEAKPTPGPWRGGCCAMRDCLVPHACRRTGRGLCRACAKAAGTYSAASKRAWADPAVRAKMSAARKRALADPAVRAKMEKQLGWLTAEETRQVVAAIANGEPYVDVANDWLVTTSTISRIARQHGIRRRPRSAAA